jgi:hypothetical protein
MESKPLKKYLLTYSEAALFPIAKCRDNPEVPIHRQGDKQNVIHT